MKINNMNNCNECIHNKVCRLVDIAKRINGKMTILFDEVEKEFKDTVSDQFEVEIKCKDFELPVPKINEINIDKLTGTGKGLEVFGVSNPCEGCPTYEMLKKGQTYVGDVPCQWCDKNPYKITWSSGTAGERK